MGTQGVWDGEHISISFWPLPLASCGGPFACLGGGQTLSGELFFLSSVVYAGLPQGIHKSSLFIHSLVLFHSPESFLGVFSHKPLPLPKPFP